jgi:hypothetical protein
MRLSIRFVFSTFVLISSPVWAAGPTTSKPGFSKKTWEGQSDKRLDPTKTEPTNPSSPQKAYDLTEQEEQARLRQRRRGPYDVNVYLGVSRGELLDNDSTLVTVLLGMRFIPHTTFDKSWDYSVEVHTKNILNTNVGYRWYFPDESYYKAYSRLSVSNYIDAGEGLAGLINMRHMKIVSSVGCSDFLEMDRHLVAEVGAGYGMAGTVFYFQAGYNYNF